MRCTARPSRPPRHCSTSTATPRAGWKAKHWTRSRRSMTCAS
ncbi:hypothetical protein VHUM_01938 [Vanrija humicola]|uniref:Uncharacterized protein n=1 Tax=Vanrija humicola TaxID=5417 RepID=A0A7D8V0U1_VANHU|nr:hypothetical protein VHUM_01938 [Vanrija humicola]